MGEREGEHTHELTHVFTGAKITERVWVVEGRRRGKEVHAIEVAAGA